MFLFYLRLIKIAHFKDLKIKVVEKKIIYGNLGMSIVIFLQVKPMWGFTWYLCGMVAANNRSIQDVPAILKTNHSTKAMSTGFWMNEMLPFPTQSWNPMFVFHYFQHSFAFCVLL